MKDLLEHLYYDQFLTQKEIAEKLGISQNKVIRLFKKYGIKARNYSEAKLKGKKKPTKDELYDLYWNKGLSTVEIGKIFGFNNNTIRRWMIEYGIPRRSLSESKFKLKLSKEELEDLYINKKLSTVEIARMYNVDMERVRNKLIYYGIKRRDRIEVRKIRVNLKPSAELSYILGVLLGDGSTCGDCAIRLSATDKIFVEKFGKALQNIGFNTHYRLSLIHI